MGCFGNIVQYIGIAVVFYQHRSLRRTAFGETIAGRRGLPALCLGTAVPGGCFVVFRLAICLLIG